MGTLFVDKLDPQSGTSLEIGSSGDTITIPSGCTITNNGTQTGFGGTNTPAFLIRKTSDQTISSGATTKVTFDASAKDVDTNSDWDATNNRFIPSVAGKYYFFWKGQASSTGGNSTVQTVEAMFYKNGSAVASSGMAIGFENNNGRYVAPPTFTILDMNGSSDYVEAYQSIYVSSGTPTIHGSSSSQWAALFGGYKIIE
jgi:hypothetical protein